MRTPSDTLAIGANIAIRAAVVVVVLFSFWTRPVMDSDVQRFSALSVAAGTPYRDHVVEYAPVELGVIRLIGSGDARATATRLVVVCFFLDQLAFAGMWSGWGRRIAITYLWLGVPLLVLRYLGCGTSRSPLRCGRSGSCGKGDPTSLASWPHSPCSPSSGRSR